MYRRIRLSNGAWSMDDVSVLRSFTERLRGIRGASGSPVLFLTRSIHTLALPYPISVVELDLNGVVQSARVAPPGRVLRFSERRWVVEYPAGDPLPALGTRIAASTMPQRCQEPRNQGH